jgi:CRISPR-associated protein Cmr2
LTTARYFPENYADKNWVDSLIENNDLPAYEKLLFLTGTQSTEKEIVIGKNSKGGDKFEKVKEYARERYRSFIGKSYKKHIEQQQDLFFTTELMADQALPDVLKYLPFGSWGMEFKFFLAKPYISHDDAPFYIIENPVRKEKVFKIPMVSSTQWKGCLHAVLARILAAECHDLASNSHADALIIKRAQLIQLFGPEQPNVSSFYKEANDNSHSVFKKLVQKRWANFDMGKNYRMGRLRFFPSYFSDIGLQIINPHDRKLKVGNKPIYMECVPINAYAIFRLLYVPFDLMGRDRRTIKTNVGKDLSLLVHALHGLFTKYGIGAKLSSGFGLAKHSIKEGQFILKGLNQTPTCDHSAPKQTEIRKDEKPISFKSFTDMKNKLIKLGTSLSEGGHGHRG